MNDPADAAFAAQPIVHPRGGKTIEEAFLAFHEANPHVYELLVSLARKAKARGRSRIGMKMLYEVARWHFYLNAKSEDEYALNNNYTSRYARLMQDREPDLADMFETRKLNAP